MTKELKNMEDTEEVRPGFFIQKKGHRYKRVYPLIWNGQWQVKEQLRTVFTLRTFFTIGLILFLAWAYQHDVQSYQDFYEDVRSDPIGYCDEVRKAIDVGCTSQDEANGLCVRNDLVNYSWRNYSQGNIGVINEENT